MELDPTPDLERVGQAVGRRRPALRQIRHDLWIVLAVELHEQRIVWRDRVNERERVASMTVVVRRLGDDTKVQDTTALGRLRVGGTNAKSQRGPCNHGTTKNAVS